MNGWGDTARETRQVRVSGQFERQLLLIPEAPLLLALLLIGWAYDFPAVVSAFVALVVAIFLVRLFLITSAAHQLERARYRRASQLSRAALRINPWSVDALMLQAQGMLLQGDDTGAEPILRRAARLAPESDLIHCALAGTLLARGKFAAGRACASYADRVRGGSPYAAQHLAWLALHVDGDAIAAQRILSTIDLERTSPTLVAPVLATLAEAQVARGTVRAAHATLVALEEMLDSCPVPQQAEFLYHLGRIQELLGEDGGSYFRRSVGVDPRGRYARAAWRAMQPGEPAQPLAAS